MGFGNYWEKVMTNHFFNIQSEVTSVLYVGLSSADPAEDGSGTSEPGGAKGYARVKTMNGSGTSWQVADASGTTIDNSAAIAFPTASADWGTMTHFAIFSGSTSGSSVCCSGALASSKTVENGDTAQFAIGALDVCLK